MTEPLTDDVLAEIKASPIVAGDGTWVHRLVAEVERLREDLVVDESCFARHRKVIADADARIVELEAEVERLRAWIDRYHAQQQTVIADLESQLAAARAEIRRLGDVIERDTLYIAELQHALSDHTCDAAAEMKRKAIEKVRAFLAGEIEAKHGLVMLLVEAL